jgi:hypothetical protein
MSATQLVENWQLYNENKEPTTAGILKWARRSADKSLLPHAYMGVFCSASELTTSFS